MGLTSLFGMERGDPHRHGHLNGVGLLLEAVALTLASSRFSVNMTVLRRRCVLEVEVNYPYFEFAEV